MSKRGNAEGSIYQRSTDGRWCAAVVYLDGDGNRRRKVSYAPTRAEAAERLTKAMAATQNGIPLPDDRITVGGFLERWVEVTVKSSVRESTYESYRAWTRNHIVPAIGRVRVWGSGNAGHDCLVLVPEPSRQ